MICLWTGKKCVTPFDFKFFKSTSSRPPRSPTDTCWPGSGHWSFLDTENHWWALSKSIWPLFGHKWLWSVVGPHQVTYPYSGSKQHRETRTQPISKTKQNECLWWPYLLVRQVYWDDVRICQPVWEHPADFSLSLWQVLSKHRETGTAFIATLTICQDKRLLRYYADFHYVSANERFYPKAIEIGLRWCHLYHATKCKGTSSTVPQHT